MARERLYEDILVPTDGSDAAETAASHALAVAVEHGATVHVLYVIDARITMAADDATRGELTAQLERDGQDAVDRIHNMAEEAGVAATRTVERGTPWKEILAYADDPGVDLIVIGTAGKSPREKRMGMGSVSERVVDDATVPVLVVPD